MKIETKGEPRITIQQEGVVRSGGSDMFFGLGRFVVMGIVILVVIRLVLLLMSWFS